LTAAYMYWLGADVLMPRDTPPLTRILSGWVPLVLHAPDPRSTKWSATNDSYLIGSEVFSSKNPRRIQLRFFGRLTFIIFPLLLIFLVWQWGRQLFGEPIAMILASSVALEPSILGHGALIKSDVPAAFCVLLFAYAAWKHLQRPNAWRLFLLTLALLAAILTKFSLLVLVPVAVILALARGPRLLTLLMIPFVLYVGVVAASQFQVQPLPDAEAWSALEAGVPAFAVSAAKLIPWPLQFVRGVLFIAACLRGTGFTGYLNGVRIEGWVPAYFPVAWMIKFPISLQILVVSGVVASCVRLRRRELGSAEVLLWGLTALFFATAVFSNFHIGIRHILPVFPLSILASGYALKLWGKTRTARVAIAVLLVGLTLSSLSVFPNGISYFNEWIGGPRRGWLYLADSNLDWGQNLPQLGAYIARNHIKRIRTFVFSSDDPYLYIKPEILEPQGWPDSVPAGYRFSPPPGLYAISANLLAGFLYPRGREDYLANFRNRTPVARAGYSILIYEVK
jgi:4-amino-4-deoxy-L-arabinose transferase-like glycosyltransferase